MNTPQTLVVMYHYVRDPDPAAWSGIHPLAPAEFEEQLDFLAGIGDIIDPRRGAQADNGRHQIILTFDDGTRDHFEQVLPVLRRRSLSGVFGVISAPVLSGHMPVVHLTHHALSRIPDPQLWQELVSFFGTAALGSAEQAGAVYSRDPLLRAQVKYALNFSLPADATQQFLRHCLEQEGLDVRHLSEQWYLSTEQIVEMHQSGMALAVHAHRHLPYQPPAEQFYKTELWPCERWLTEFLGTRPRHYIAAFGGTNSGGHDVGELGPVLTACGYEHGFLTEAGIQPVGATDFFYKRVDAVDLPPRQDGEICLKMLQGEGQAVN